MSGLALLSFVSASRRIKHPGEFQVLRRKAPLRALLNPPCHKEPLFLPWRRSSFYVVSLLFHPAVNVHTPKCGKCLFLIIVAARPADCNHCLAFVSDSRFDTADADEITGILP